MLILLVVLGHVAGGGCHLATGAACESLRMVYFLIYAFHMPAFFFLAGWMWRDKPFKEFALGRFNRLMIPYFVVGVISILIFAAVGGNRVMDAAFTSDYYKTATNNSGAILNNLLSLLHAGGWPNGQGFRYNTVLWFLPCMYMTIVVYGAMKGMVRGLEGSGVQGFRSSGWMLVAGTVVFVVSCLMSECGVGGWVWCVDRIPCYLTFVILGEVMHGVWKEGVPRLRMWFLLPLIALYGLAVWQVAYCYAIHNWLIYPARLAITLCGIYLSMLLAQAIKGRMQTWLCTAGICSMTIMLWHKFFVVALQVKVPIVGQIYRSVWLGACMATIVITVACVLACLLMVNGWTRLKRRVYTHHSGEGRS